MFVRRNLVRTLLFIYFMRSNNQLLLMLLFKINYPKYLKYELPDKVFYYCHFYLKYVFFVIKH